jgi:hypothetical protein
VRQLLSTTKTYFHPSNQDRWTGYLGAFLSELGTYFAKRAGKEIRAELPVAKENKIDFEDTRCAGAAFFRHPSRLQTPLILACAVFLLARCHLQFQRACTRRCDGRAVQ